MSNDVNLWDLVIADVKEEDRKEFAPDKPASEHVVEDDILIRVIADMRARDHLGTLRYAKPLTPEANIDFLKEAYEELLDAVVYLRGWIAKHEATYRESNVMRGVFHNVKNQYRGLIRDLWMMAYDRARLEELKRSNEAT